MNITLQHIATTANIRKEITDDLWGNVITDITYLGMLLQA